MTKEIIEMSNDISIAWQEANKQQCTDSNKSQQSLCEIIAEILCAMGYKKEKIK